MPGFPAKSVVPGGNRNLSSLPQESGRGQLKMQDEPFGWRMLREQCCMHDENLNLGGFIAICLYLFYNFDHTCDAERKSG